MTGQQATILGGEQAPPAAVVAGGGSQPAPAGGNGVVAPGANGGADPAAAAAAAAAGAAPAAWFAGQSYTDEDRAFLANKGWATEDGHQKMLKGYRDLEKVFGGRENAVLIPKADDPVAKKEFWAKLGVPETEDKYTLPSEITEEQQKAMNPRLLGFYRKAALSNNMTPAQFQGFLTDYNKEVEAQKDEAITSYNGEVKQIDDKFKTEFGQGYGEQVARGNLAMNKLGLNRDDMAELQGSIGIERANRMLFKLGEMLAQHDTSVGLGGGNTGGSGFVTDKAKAQARVTAIKSLAKDATGPDADFRKVMLDPQHPEHKNANAQWRKWNRLANSQ